MRSFRITFRIEATSPLLMGFANEKDGERTARGERDPLIILPPRVPPPEADVTAAQRRRLERLRVKALAKWPDAIVLPDLKSEREPVLRELAARRLSVRDGVIGVPADAMFACLRDAGKSVKIGKKRVTAVQGGTTLPALVEFETSFFALQSAAWKPDYRFLARESARLKLGDYRVVVQPRFDEWAIEGMLVVHMRFGFTLDHAEALVRIAGETVGLGSMRGKRKGYVNFGSFRTTRWDAQEITVHRPTFAEVARKIEPPSAVT